MPLHVLDIHADGRATTAPDTAPTGPGVFRWFHFDLADPTLAAWSTDSLPERAADALLDAETRPRCDALGDGVILNLRAVNLNPGQQTDQMASIRIWATQTLVVTVRVRRIFSLETIRENAEAGDAPRDVGHFLAALVDGLALRMRAEVLKIETVVEDLETRFEEDEILTASLQSPRRRVIRFLRYMLPQKEALHRMLSLDLPVLSDEARLDLREGVNQVLLATEALQAQKSRLEALQDYADAVTAQKMARNSYGLSLVAAVFLPLGFLTGLFGVNVAGMPGLEAPWAFAILTAALVITGGLCLAILRWLRML